MVDRDVEIEVFDLTSKGDAIMMEAMQAIEGLGVSRYSAVITAFIYGVMEPSETLQQEEEAMLHALMENFIKERTEILDGTAEVGYSAEN